MSAISGVTNFLYSAASNNKNASVLGSIPKGAYLGGALALVGAAMEGYGRTQDSIKTRSAGWITLLIGGAVAILSAANHKEPGASTKSDSSDKKDKTGEGRADRNKFEASQGLKSDSTFSSSRTQPEDKAMSISHEANLTIDAGSLDRWSDRRVLVDTMQNHVDETRIQKASLWEAGKKQEAGHFKANAEFILRDGRRISVYDAEWGKVKHKDVAEVVFSDKGDGYSTKRLELIWSSGKRVSLQTYQEMGINPPAGQFGEGLKMVKTSILVRQERQKADGVDEDKRIGITFRSRDWKATLVGEKEEDDKGSTMVARHKIEEGLQKIKGSQTAIQNPTEEMVELLKDMGNLCLDFDPPKNRVMASQKGSIYKLDGAQQIYVKGLSVAPADDIAGKGHGSIYSYDLMEMDINRDRDKIEPREAKYRIGGMLVRFANEDVILKLLDIANKGNYTFSAESASSKSDSSGGKEELEFQSLVNGMDIYGHYLEGDEAQKKVWKEAFYKKFGANAILASSSDATNKSTRRANDEGEKVITLNLGLYKVLKACGVETDQKYESKALKKYELGIDIDEQKERWGPLRMVLDSLQNHADIARLERDYDRECLAKVEIEVDGKWISLSKITGYTNDQITGVRFSDNSEYGYSHGHLAQLSGSGKTESSSVQVGGFGEGIKLAAASGLGHGLDIGITSQDWQAEAFSYKHTIEDKKAGNSKVHHNIGFQVTSKPHAKVSETIIKLPKVPRYDSRENLNKILNILRDLDKYVLRHKEIGLADTDPTSLDTHEDGNVISADEGNVFVKDFFISNEERARLLHGYNFHHLKTNRDRNLVSNNELIKAVGNIVANLENEDLIAHIIAKAIHEPSGKYHEFQNVSMKDGFRGKEKHWVNAFQEVINSIEAIKDKKKVALGSREEGSNREAEWRGYTVLQVNDEIAKVLKAAGVPDAADVLRSKYPPISEASLDEDERKTIELARWLDSEEIFFNQTMPTNYEVFETAISLHDNEPVEGSRGYCDIAGREKIGFKRAILRDPVVFLYVYLEEKAHQFSGAGDGDRSHFNKAKDAIITTMFTSKRDEVIAKFKDTFDGFDISHIISQPVAGDSSRTELVYKRPKAA